MDLKKLAEPFPASDVEWRVQSSGVKGDGSVWARVLAYITNRAIMERLDEVCGPANWRNEFRHEANGAVLCGISIRVLREFGDLQNEGESYEWVTKWDGAENTDIEAVKGGLSGAMKRAGYQWGIGRYLYQLEEGFARVSENGAHFAKTKDGKAFKWDAPALPLWALPGGSGKAVASNPAPNAPAAASRSNKSSAPSTSNMSRTNHADKKLPFGDKKGTPLGELSADELEKLLVWCRVEERAEKFRDLAVSCAAVLTDRVLTPAS
jgi:hypothetical protein